jgi:hypothetical protein
MSRIGLFFGLALGFGVALSLCGCASTKGHQNSTDPTPEPEVDVFAECVDFATRLCADAETCCNQAYGSFDPDGCLATLKRDVCRPGADAVTAGRATYDPDAVDDCLAAHAEANAICTPTWQQTLELRKRSYTACRVIDGTTKPGGGCSIAATCQQPEGVAIAECVKNVCKVVQILAEGAQCPFPMGAVSVCDEGLACDAPGLETTGHCVKAIPTDGACDNSMLETTECGLGSYCDTETATCKVTSNMGGPGCAQSTECVSFDCDRLGQECAPASAVVSRTTCMGPDAMP